MELIRISKRKLKIMLTATDMCHFELNPDSFGVDSTQMHHTFRLLLDEIKRQTDFDADDHQISVQYFPSREGGCEMFISRLASNDDRQTSQETTPSQERALQVRIPHAESRSFKKECAYRFEELSDLLSVCKRMRDVGYIGDSVAYKDEKGAYFLLITVRTSSPFSMPDEWNFILEYGSLENAALLKLYILEHGTLICPTAAVNTLACLA